MQAASEQTQRLTFQGLSRAVISAWALFGFSWQEMVDGFGGGSGGLGMPAQDDFYELARDAVDIALKDEPEPELRRLMHSRLYRKHRDFEQHYSFTHGNEQFINRDELLGRAVWSYLCHEMERQYVSPPSVYDDEEEEEPNQLVLPL